jgi:hypothetical protein
VLGRSPNKTEPTGSRQHVSPGGDPASDQRELAPDRGFVAWVPLLWVWDPDPGDEDELWLGRSPDDAPGEWSGVVPAVVPVAPPVRVPSEGVVGEGPAGALTGSLVVPAPGGEGDGTSGVRVMVPGPVDEVLGGPVRGCPAPTGAQPGNVAPFDPVGVVAEPAPIGPDPSSCRQASCKRCRPSAVIPAVPATGCPPTCASR